MRNGEVETRFGEIVLRKDSMAISRIEIEKKTEGIVLRKEGIAIKKMLIAI